MKYSIVIPTYNHCEDLLMPCLSSIIRYTDLSDSEVVVSANGCTDGTREYVESLGNRFKLVWSDAPTGYTKATNDGIKVTTGEYVILLNNDIELINQQKNTWVNQLVRPFTEDPLMGGTGPFLMGYPRFIVFFCAMIKRTMFDKFGLLDEIFSPGTCEDVDFCAKMQLGGYRIAQIPSETRSFLKNDQNRMIGGCPICHKGTQTFGAGGGDPEIVARNKRIILERYGPVPKGFFEDKQYV